MKVKRIIVSILMLSALLLIALFISGCHHQKFVVNNLTALEIGGFDAHDGGNHKSEYSEWSDELLNYHVINSVDDEIIISFNGNEYRGTYQRSATRIPCTNDWHRYKGDGVIFDVDSKSGRLQSISFISEPAEKATVSEAECRIIADELAKKYIDLNEFEVNVIKQDIQSNYFCYYTYYRTVDKYKTSDSLNISIDGNGNIRSFGMTTLDSFSKELSLIIDENALQSVIEEKIDSIYSKLKNYSYEVLDVILVQADGKYGLLYTISMNIGTTSINMGEGAIEASQLQILIILE